MLHLHPQRFTKSVNPGKPVPHAGEQLDGLAAAVQERPVQLDALRGTLLNHGVHIGQQAVHAVLPAECIGFSPEFRRGIAQGGDESVILHIRGTQGLIKVV